MPLDLATIRARYLRAAPDKPLWQEVCADVGALCDEVEKLRADCAELQRAAERAAAAENANAADLVAAKAAILAAREE